MKPYPLPVNIYLHYCQMIDQIQKGTYQDPFGMERIRVNHEVNLIIELISGVSSGYHMVIKLYTGELLISSSFEDLRMLSDLFTIDDINYYGLVNEGTIAELRKISYG